jgi:general secretion pathway protein I
MNRNECRVLNSQQSRAVSARTGTTHPGSSLRNRQAFTLIEVLAAMMLMAIILPPVMQGIAIATRTASESRTRTEAAGLAEEKLNELIATGQWQNGNTAGDFGTDWPKYRWQANIYAWPYDTSAVGLQQIDLSVLWTGTNNQQKSIMISTLAYVRGGTSTTTAGIQ